MQHLAIIPDGNRRWAAAHKLESFWGHKKGLDAVEASIKVCIEQGIKYLSFYTFSLENFRRSDAEKNYLFNELLAKEFKKALPKLEEQQVRVRFLGDSSYFPAALRPVIELIEQRTAQYTVLNLNLLFCYGARQEIVHAVKNLAARVQAGEILGDDITEQVLSESLWTSGMPDPDLILRTGKTSRMSNFLLYQAAYSEIMHLDYFWPEVTEGHIKECLESFNTIKRNFGS